MLPPGNLAGARTSEARLRGAAHQLWPEWSNALTSITGIDNGFMRSGGLEVRLPGSSAELAPFSDEIATLREEGVVVETADPTALRDRFPVLGTDVAIGYFLPDFYQVRNPRHLKSLIAGCQLRGVQLVERSPVRRFEGSANRITAVHAGEEVYHAAEFVVASGAWSGELLREIGVRLAIEPLKGQIVLLRAMSPLFSSVIQMGREYLVPRVDGRILVGSTEEHCGFDKRNTVQAVADLITFAQKVVPGLKTAVVEKCWAGLRPYSDSGKPYIGRLPQFANVCVATGHSRSGLHLSPLTATLIRQILLEEPVLLPDECRVSS